MVGPFAHQSRQHPVEEALPEGLLLMGEVFLKHGAASEDIVLFLEGLTVFQLCQLPSQVPPHLLSDPPL